MKTQNDNGKNKANLKMVLKQLMSCIGLSANALAKTLNLPTPTIQRLLTGEVLDPRTSTLMTIADYFGISIDQLLGRETLISKFQEHSKNQPAVRPPNSIPILSLAEACDYENIIKPTDWLRWQHQYKSGDQAEFNRLFAVPIKNDLYKPIFITGTYIIVNPIAHARSGDYVLVKFLNDPIPVIKKYIAEGEHKYLYSLKSEVKTIALELSKCIILGVISESYVNFKFMEV